ncbi:hypothetical protein ACWD6P_20795 [Streptomyces sp. NPDC002446]
MVLALVLFAVAIALKRRGRLDRARRYADPVLRATLHAAARRVERGSFRTGRRDGRRDGEGRGRDVAARRNARS